MSFCRNDLRNIWRVGPYPVTSRLGLDLVYPIPLPQELGRVADFVLGRRGELLAQSLSLRHARFFRPIGSVLRAPFFRGSGVVDERCIRRSRDRRLRRSASAFD